MIKNMRFAVTGAVMAAGMGFTMTAHAAVSDTATATAEILEALAIVADGTDLDFGTIALKDLTSGTEDITLSPTNDLTCPSATFICAGTTSVPTFNLTGYNGANVSVSLTDSAISLSDGTNSMPLSLNLSDTSVTLDGSGQGSFTVGGTLTVAAGQAAGVYSGTFEANVEYQ